MPSGPIGTMRGLIAHPQRRTRVQTALFVISAASAGALGIASQALIAQELGLEQFAVYAFCFSLLQFSAILFEFGLFIPAARRAALARSTERRAIVGAALITYVPVGLAFSLVVFCVSFGIDGLVSFNASETLRVAAAGAFVFPFLLVAQSLSQGTGRLHVFSLTSLFWQLLFAITLAGLALAGIAYDSGEALLLREAAMASGAALACVWLRPRFAAVLARMRALTADSREYGFSIYIGRVLSIGSYNMDVLLVGLFAGAEDVAVYSIAKLLAYGVSLPASGAAGALFGRMATMPALQGNWLRFAYGSGFGLALLLALVAAPLIDVGFGDEYDGAVVLVLPLAIAEAIRGVTAFYNHFLNSHARGREVREAGFAFTVANVVASLSLIPTFGAAGAAAASLIATVVNLAAHVIGYRRSRGPLSVAARADRPLRT